MKYDNNLMKVKKSLYTFDNKVDAYVLAQTEKQKNMFGGRDG